MRRKIYLNLKLNFVIFFSIFGTASAQSIEENRVDEFTGSSIKRTSWENFAFIPYITAYFRFSQVDDSLTLDVRLVLSKDYVVNEGQDLMFKFHNGEMLTLKSKRTRYSCAGCGAVNPLESGVNGLETSYTISKEHLKKLMEVDITKFRIYVGESYYENEFKEKHKERFRRASKLILEK